MPSNPDSNPQHDFRTCLKKSKVLKPEVLDKWLTENPDHSPTQDATQLVKQNLLTEWQAKYLLSGRYRLHLGNYQLLRRVRRDSFGDRFVALHPQLGRTAQVQVLPVELTDAPLQRTEFLKKAGLASELDHPNLAHVFDIDKQQGRYYLVTEHSPGQSLTELRATPLNAHAIARIVGGSIAGLKHAHERSVVHGNLSMDNVLVNEDGFVKISQIALSPLAKKSTAKAKENVSREQGDLLAIVRIGRRLLNDVPSSRMTRQLSKLLSNLNTKDEADFATSLAALEIWIEESSTEPTSKKRTESSQSASSMDSVSVGEIERLTKNAQLTEGQKTPSKQRKSAKWEQVDRSSNFARIGGIAALIFTIGLLGHFGLAMIRQLAPSRPSAQNWAETQARGTPLLKRSPTGPNTLVPPTVSQDKGISESSEQPQGRTPGNQSRLPKSTLPTPIVNPNAFRPKPDDEQASPNKTFKKNATPASRATSTTRTDGLEPINNGSDQAPFSTPPNSQPDITAPRLTDDSAGVATATLATPEPQQANDRKDEASKRPEPFAGIPESVDLPSIQSVEEVVLVEIERSSIHLLTVSLKSAVGIGKGKTTFDLKRNETTKRQWTLLAKKTPRNNGDAVGQFDFDKATGQLKFRWLPEAAESRIADYVRNCAVKLSLADASRTIALRSPVTLPDLKLTRQQPFARLEAAIEWLPNLELITVELLPFKSAGLPKTWLEPAIVQSGTPSAIHFHEAASNRFMWLQLATNIRANTTFDLSLMLKHADGTVQAISRSEDVKKLPVLLREAAVTAQQEYDANKDLVAPRGQITKFKEFVARLKSIAKKTQRQSEIAVENSVIVENLYDRVIPMRVMIRTDDYQVVLVDSTR